MSNIKQGLENKITLTDYYILIQNILKYHIDKKN